MAKQKIATIKVNKAEVNKANFRGARAAWLEAITAYDGKALTAFGEHVTANPPSTPKTGKYRDTCEPYMGWVRFFVRQELVQIVNK